LAIAKFKYWRYLYFIYPAFGILIGLLTFYLYQFIRETSGKWKKYILPAGTALFIFFIIFQVVHALSFTSNLEQKKFDVFLLYFNSEGTELIISRLDRRDFERSEFLHLFCAENKIFTGEEIDQIVPRLSAKNSVLLSRKDYMRAVERERINLKNTDALLFFNFSCPESFTANTPKEKVAVFRKDSDIAAYLGTRNIRLYPVTRAEESIDYNIKNNEEFFESISLQVLGYPLSNYASDYYLGMLNEGKSSRKEIAAEFICAASRINYHYRIYNQHYGEDQGFFKIDQPYRILNMKDMSGNVTALGISYSNLDPPVVCELLPTLFKWNWFKRESVPDMIEKFTRIKKDHILVLKRNDLTQVLKMLTGKNRAMLGICEFRVNPVDKEKSDDLMIVFRLDSKYSATLRSKGISFEQI
jgi:hypothetical protein